MFCSLEELVTESDVEQKLFWPLLIAGVPNGLGFRSADILTKSNIRRLEIGKGSSKKLYFPDYLVVLAGLPVAIAEAKAPGQSIQSALTEARLYGGEINALFPSGNQPLCASYRLQRFGTPIRTGGCSGARLPTQL